MTHTEEHIVKNFTHRAVTRTQEFIADHKTAIIVTTTATATFVVTAAMARAMTKGYTGSVNEFLTEKGLMEEFNALFADPTDI